MKTESNRIVEILNEHDRSLTAELLEVVDELRADRDALARGLERLRADLLRAEELARVEDVAIRLCEHCLRPGLIDEELVLADDCSGGTVVVCRDEVECGGRSDEVHAERSSIKSARAAGVRLDEEGLVA